MESEKKVFLESLHRFQDQEKGTLKLEIEKLTERDYPVYVVNLKPMYREKILEQLKNAGMDRVEAMIVGEAYEF